MSGAVISEAVFACARDERERLAVEWRLSYKGWTWVHAAHSVGYDGVSRTLCGRRPYDPDVRFRGADAWNGVDCKACRRAIARLEGSK